MGRNKIYKDGKERIGVDLSPAELEAFDQIRWRERKGKSELARMALLEYIKKHGDGNDTYKLDKFVENPDFQITPAIDSDKLKWRTYYQNSTKEDRTKLRSNLNQIIAQIQNVDFNEGNRIKMKFLE